VWLRFRTELRSRWRGWLVLAVVSGVAGGFVVAAVAGARRTDSALARHLVAFRFPHAIVGADEAHWNHTAAEIRALPEVTASSVTSELGFCARDAQNRPVIDVGPQGVAFIVNIDGRDGVALHQPKLLAGRAPNPTRPREALVDSRAAARFGVRPGDMIPIRVFREGSPKRFRCDPTDDSASSGRRIDLSIVGVNATTGPLFPNGTVTLTPAFDRLYRSDAFYYDRRVSVRLRGGAAAVPAFRASVARIVGAGDVDATQGAAKIQRSIHHQAQALRLATTVSALLALVLLAQALARVAAFAALQHPTLRALGMTRRQLAALGVARAAAIAVAAAALAAALAAVLSPLTPIGIARELEPEPGFVFDPLAVGVGSGAVLVIVLLAGAITSARAARARAFEARPLGAVSRGSGPADALARRGLPPTVVSGVRLALVRGGGSTAVPVGATVLGAVAAIAVVATALTFTASLDHLFSTPRLYGQAFDYRSEFSSTVSPAAIRADESISDAARGVDKATVLLDGRQVGAVAMQDIKGRIRPVVTGGRAPERRDEILLAAKTLDALGLEIGDSVEARGDSVEARFVGSARLRIVGRGVVQESISNELGSGAWLTLSAYRRLDRSTDPYALQARIAPGADREATLARLERQHVTPAPGPPRTIADFGGVDELPLVVSALLSAIAAGTLAHTLAVAIRRRRRHVAILKTLGFDRRQVFVTVAWQATTFALVGLAVGLPLGVAVGRWVWTLFADEIGVIPEPVTPRGLILLVVPAAVLLANLVAVVPARSAARTRAALALRAE